MVVKKISLYKMKDFVINILSSFLLTGMVQIFVYPILGKHLTPEKYGTILMLIGIVNVIGASIGAPLNNTKILMNSEYEKRKIKGDYNLVAIVCLLITFSSTITITSFVEGKILLDNIFLGLISSFVFFRSYYSAGYRIEINFKSIFMGNFFGVIGYLIGIFVFLNNNIWYWIFFFGELFSCLYIGLTSFIIKEPLKKTPLINVMLNRYGCYFIANFFTYLISYIDRFFLYPILGGESVSLYTTSSILGKIAGMVMTPISGVLLTYYCKEDGISMKTYFKRISIYFLLSIISYLGIIILGFPILKLLYPTLAMDAKPYFYIANLGSIVLLLGDAIMPILLRYSKPFWSPLIQFLFALFYISLGFIGMYFNGLMGFCYAVVIVNVFRLILLIVISFYVVKLQNKKFNNNIV